ncbi:MAG: hypothetical protein F4018_05870, partial [Acidobacteria bacterium]|nr:hypothetical protein [Acidobacteriota bacterium]
MQVIEITDLPTLTAPDSLTDGEGAFGDLEEPYDVAVYVGRDKDGMPTLQVLVSSEEEDAVTFIDMSDPTSLEHLGEASDLADGFPNIRVSELDGPRGIATLSIGSTDFALVAAYEDDGLQILSLLEEEARAVGIPIDRNCLGPGSGCFELLDGAHDVATFSIGAFHFAAVTAHEEDSVAIYDVTNPHEPMKTAQVTDEMDGFTELEGPKGIAAHEIAGSRFLVVTSSEDDGVQVINVTDPWNPQPSAAATDDVGGLDVLDGAADVATMTIGGKHYAMVAAEDDSGLQIIELRTDPPPVFQQTSYSFRVDENETSGPVGAVRAVDPASQTVTYSVGGTDEMAFNDDFELSTGAGIGRITVKPGATIDFETRDSYAVTVTATDSVGVTARVDVTINVNNLDEPGTVKLSATTPAVGQDLSATVTDPDGSVSGENWTWARSASRTSGFTTIAGANTATYTPEAADLNRYLRAMVTYTDAHGSNKTAQVASGNATASSRPPAFGASSYTFTVDENETSGTVGTVSATDPDVGDTVTYSVRGTDATAFNDDFELNSMSGAVTVRSNATIDYETRSSYSVTIRAADEHNSSNDVVVTVSVSNLDDAGVVRLSAITPSQDTPLTATLTDEDGPVSSVTWSWSSAATRTGSFTAISGATDAGYTPVAGDVGSYLKATASYTDAFGSGKSAEQVSENAVTTDPPPVFPNPTATFTVVQNATSGTVGTVRATDPASQTVTYSLRGTDEAAFNDDFELSTVSGSGRITVKSGATIDYETKASYSVDIIATDSVGGTAKVVVTITVVDRLPPQVPVIGIGIGGGGGGGDGPSPSTLDFEWTVEHDIEELDSGQTRPTGLWSDGVTLWLLNNPEGAGDAVFAYDRETGERLEDRGFELARGNHAPRGIWSDGTGVVWVSDSGRDQLFAYDLATGERLEDRDLQLAARNRDARGIWSDGETMWVLDGVRDALFAYDLASGELLAEYALDDANGDPRGLWSDGVTVWVSDHGAKRLFAYRLPARADGRSEEALALERVTEEDFAEPGRVGNNSPRGIWSDGAVMYVAAATAGKIYT